MGILIITLDDQFFYASALNRAEAPTFDDSRHHRMIPTSHHDQYIGDAASLIPRIALVRRPA
jgi:hypothetical protein